MIGMKTEIIWRSRGRNTVAHAIKIQDAEHWEAFCGVRGRVDNMHLGDSECPKCKKIVGAK